MPDQPSFHDHAPAKINLTLAVTGRRGDGYHLLDSVVVFAAIGDHLSLTPADADHLEITGPFADAISTEAKQENSVWRSLNAFRYATGWTQPFSVKLHKELPVAAGIGGGSSDAAAMLRLLNRVAPIPLGAEDLCQLALDIGADVPVCLKADRGGFWRMRGIGERVESLPATPGLGLILLNNGIKVATKDVFAALGTIDGVKPERSEHISSVSKTFSGPGSMAKLGPLIEGGNDLLLPAIHVAPEISRSLDILASLRSSPGFIAAGMSGSGATCFALFTQPDAAISARHSLREIEGWCWAGAIR